ncbi:transcriptional regulator [Pelobium manganitolerans]|uniref:Transcriptional regulator n=1 Tax=Pelobium manganitolerans TaxID=1842495 RepID=A0A419S234_9SPHI|nr:helix-turn-helix domain-containing protein [Pelobium manganitolerans]RKD12770.1 transcriptional regulator [Pelobium manganitolerans]
MNIEILTKADLQTFKTELLNDIKQLFTNKNSDNQKWLKGIDVRKLLNISAGTLQNLRINGTLNPSKIGGTLFYNKREIEKMLEANHG